MTSASHSRANDGHMAATFDVIIVGAGFAGLYALHNLRGLGYSARIFEAGDGVGGTWYWNRYPGARVDIESHEYSYSFSEELEKEWKWTERYAAQPELLRYINHVADRFDLKRDIQFETRVTAAIFDEANNRWTVSTDRGDRVTARFCVMATGCLSAAKDPDFEGAGAFKGKAYQTARWPHEGVDFTGQRVAVIGTGSSAIQSIPQIAKQADHLTVFQRTPNFSLPARNGAVDPRFVEEWLANREANRRAQRQSVSGILQFSGSDTSALEVSDGERREIYEECWRKGGFALAFGSFNDIVISKEANDTASEFVREKIRGIVKDPVVAGALSPRNHPFVAKRPCVDTGYFETYNRDNVTLVDLSVTPIESITTTGIKTTGTDYSFDAIVFALGFDAMTGALGKIDIRGRGGRALKDKWADGPRTYLGLTIAGFPNLFIVTGPGSPAVLANMVIAIEQHVDWIAGCIDYLKEHQVIAIEATETAENDWVAHVNEVADATLYPLANTWYMGSNVAGKPRVFLPYVGGFDVYQQKCQDVVANGYDGFALSMSAQLA